MNLIHLVGLISLMGFLRAEEPRINIIYPKEKQIFPSVKGQFILGHVASSTAFFMINAQTVTVHSNGAFLAYLPVEPGTFTFRCELIVGTSTLVAHRNILVSFPPPAPPADRVWIDVDSVFPKFLVELRAGDRLLVGFRGTLGGEAEFQIKGVKKHLPMIMADSSGAYQGIYEISAEDVAENAAIVFTLKHPQWGKTYAQAKGKLSVSKGAPRISRVIMDYVGIRTAPELSYLLTVSSGTKLIVVGREGSDVRVSLSSRLAGWVSENSLSLLPVGTPVPQAVLSDIHLQPGNGSTDVLLTISEKVPYLVDVGDSVIDVRLFYTQFGSKPIPFTVYHSTALGVEHVDWQQEESDVCRIRIRLARWVNVWGYRASYRGRHLVLEIRKPPVVSRSSSSPLKGRVIVVDPGHGGSDNGGSIGSLGTFEKDAAWMLSKVVQELLEKEGARVVLTRGEMDEVALNQRVRIASSNQADLFVSLHFDQLPDGVDPFSRIRGFKVFYHTLYSRKLAEGVHNSLGKQAHLPDDGLWAAPFLVLRNTEMPSVLIESAFLVYPEHESLFLDKGFQKRWSKAVVKGIKKFLELELKKR